LKATSTRQNTSYSLASSVERVTTRCSNVSMVPRLIFFGALLFFGLGSIVLQMKWIHFNNFFEDCRFLGVCGGGVGEKGPHPSPQHVCHQPTLYSA
jgi:hypothetical protein